MKILTNKEVDIKKWNNLLKGSEQSSPFQTPAYYDFFNSMKSLSASVHAVEQGSELKALCVVTLQKEKGLKGYFSRRAIIYGGPLINDQNQEAFSLLLKSIRTYYRNKAIYIEIRNFFDYSIWKGIYFKQKWTYIPYLNFQLSLQGETKESILKNFKPTRRQQIKKSIKNEATYSLTKSIEEVSKIYEILCELYKEKVKVPLPSFDFFEKQIQADLLKVFVVKHDNEVIGGTFCPVLPNRGIYIFYSCGLRNYHKNIFPTHLALLAAMEYGIDNNIPLYDFMGAGIKGMDYGVREYKEAFGGELVEHGRYVKILNPVLYKLGKLGLRLLSKLT